MGKQTPVTLPKPSLKKQKAVRNLKDMLRSDDKDKIPVASGYNPTLFEPGKPSEPLQYERLKSLISKKIGNYILYAISGYIYFTCGSKGNGEQTKADKRAFYSAKHKETGWKLHISVAPEQISSAWSVIYPILMEYQLSAKVLSPHMLTKKGIEELSTKQFTLYAFKNKHLDKSTWTEVMQKIENELHKNNIGKGIIPPANKCIPNSDYFSYRNDEDANGNYVSDVAAAFLETQNQNLLAYNLSKTTDPFEGIALGENPLSASPL